jgi:nucleoside-diphosphate-sugar epimerase
MSVHDIISRRNTMRVFVTGASGWIGSHVVPELLAAGHQVVGLARSDASAAALEARGVVVRRGDLDDPAGIGAAAAEADGVVHLANKHDWTDPAISNSAERDAVEAILEALEGTDRPFAMASGIGVAGHGRPFTEADASPAHGRDSMRGGGENLAMAYADRGVRSIALRFAPTVHGEGDHGFIALYAEHARRRGSVPYVGDGANHWPAVHVHDAARLTRLGLEHAPAGSRLHAVAEGGVRIRDVADVLAARMELPTVSVTAEELAAELPFVGMFLGVDVLATNDTTRELLGWEPTGPSLLDDVRAGFYDR